MIQVHRIRTRPENATAVCWDGTEQGSIDVMSWFLSWREESLVELNRVRESCKYISSFNEEGLRQKLVLDFLVMYPDEWLVREKDGRFTTFTIEELNERYEKEN